MKIDSNMAKFYFQKNDINCYTIDYHLEYMKENGLSEMDVFEAKVERGTGYFYCKELYEVGESGFCGIGNCHKYTPRNGKSGVCKHHGNVYEQTEVKRTLSI